MNLIDIFRAFHTKVAEYKYFSSTHGMFSRIHHMLGHKTSLNKFNNTEIVLSIFSDHNATKLEIFSWEQHWKTHKGMETK